MTRRSRPAAFQLLALALALVLALLLQPAAADADGSAAADAADGSSGGGGAAWSVGALRERLGRAATRENLLWLLDTYRAEAYLAALLLAYLAANAAGAVRNRSLARAWLSELRSPAGALAANFATSAPGAAPGGPVEPSASWREAADEWRLYATGRRHCTGAVLAVKLRARQDVVSHFAQSLAAPSSSEDTLTVRVGVPAAPTAVLALARAPGRRSGGAGAEGVAAAASAKRLKKLLRAEPRLAACARAVAIDKSRFPGGWPADERPAVAAELSALLYDAANVEPGVARLVASPWLRSLVLRDDAQPAGQPPGPSLEVVFGLPPPPLLPEQMRELQPLLAAVFALGDLAATYKLPADAARRAQELRARLEQEAAKREGTDRDALAQQRRQERLEAERAKARAQGPAALQKFEERLQKRNQDRAMRKRTLKA